MEQEQGLNTNKETEELINETPRTKVHGFFPAKKDSLYIPRLKPRVLYAENKSSLPEKINKVGLFLVSIIFHLVVIIVLWIALEPFVKWYLSQDPIRGIDLFNNITYTKYVLNWGSTIFSSWKYIWYQGSPFGLDYPYLYYYPMAIFAGFFGLIKGVQFFSLTMLFIFVIFSYLLFWELSRNRFISALLALGVMYSPNIYKALIWAGGIPYFASQAILPIAAFCIVKYLKTNNQKWFVIGALVTGLGILGHPQPVIFYAIPTVIVIILLWSDQAHKALSFYKFKQIVKYLTIVFLISTVAFSKLFIDTLIEINASLFGSFGKTVPAMGSEQVIANDEIRKWAISQVDYVKTQTNEILWIVAVVSILFFILTFIFHKRKIHSLWNFQIGFLPMIGVILAVFLYARGYIQFIGGWYKIYWEIPVLVGLFAAIIWGIASKSIGELSFLQHRHLKYPKIAFILIINAGIIFASFYLFNQYSRGFLPNLQKISNPSSAFPTALNTSDSSKREAVINQLLPNWLSKSQKNYRLYEIDATVNIWWNTFFDIPLRRGYTDPPVADNGNMFWLNSAIGKGKDPLASSSLEGDWKVPKEIVNNNLLYLLDWGGVKYLEGNHNSVASFASLNGDILSQQYLQNTSSQTFTGNYHYQIDADWVWNPKGIEQLNFYELKNEIVSPIMYSTNAPSVLVIGHESAFNTINRLFGEANLNSQKLVFVKGEKFIDQYGLSDLKNFDLVILYGYDYKNQGKAWTLISKYIEGGGKVFIDTGNESKESATKNLPGNFVKELPEFFPIKQTVREDLGKQWTEASVSANFSKGVNIGNFSKLEFDKQPWNISFPPGAQNDLNNNAEVIFTLKNKPVIAKKSSGHGKIIWSGLNLPYHIIRTHNKDELTLMLNVLSDLISINQVSPVNTNINWISPEKREISVLGAKGVLLKEEDYSGWKAYLDHGQNLKIFSVGPTYKGYMYVSVPQGQRNGKVTFKYSGETKYKIYTIISLITLFFIIDYVLLNKLIFNFLNNKLFKKIFLRSLNWWEKDEN